MLHHTLVKIEESKSHFLENFILKKQIGKGSFGEVYEASSKSDSSTIFAIKCIKKEYLNKEAFDDIKNEAAVLLEISHPNIVNYHSHHADETHFYMVMEYCPNGELTDNHKFDK